MALDSVPIASPAGASRATGNGDARSFVVIVATDYVKKHKREVLAKNFSLVEIDALATAAPQTVAGFWAIKKALIALYSSLTGSTDFFAERDFILARNPRGAPLLVSSPAIAASAGENFSERIHLSTSHTDNHVCGLAVVEEKAGV